MMIMMMMARTRRQQKKEIVSISTLISIDGRYLMAFSAYDTNNGMEVLPGTSV